MKRKLETENQVLITQRNDMDMKVIISLKKIQEEMNIMNNMVSEYFDYGKQHTRMKTGK